MRNLLILLLLAALPARAQPTPAAEPLRLSTAEGRLLRLPRAPANVLLADPSIADVATPSPTQIFVFGKKPGRTTLFALDADGAQIASWRIMVSISDAEMRELIRAEVGNYPVRLAFTPAGAVLSGTVPSPKVAERVRAIAARYLADGQSVVDNMVVTGTVQVRLRVRVAEVTRSVAKELGINWAAVGSSGNFAFGLLSGRAALDTAGNVARSASGASSLFGAVRSGGTNITGVIDALATEGLVQVLAEPTLLAASGETAKFLAGGEFPVPIGQGLNNISIEYRRFGVGLEFRPVVINDDLISIHVTPEVSALSTDSSSGAINANGFAIPALTVRRAETTIELGSGQSFAIGGLLQNNMSTQASRIPILGDIPILGTLFRSSRFQRDETELVIIVTPTLVRPVAGPGALRLPTDTTGPPSDVERILRARLSQSPAGQAALERMGTARFIGDAGFLLE